MTHVRGTVLPGTHPHQVRRRRRLELGKLLDGEAGPYILTDLRWGNGPLHVRYGGFASRCPGPDGTPVLAVARPDGTLVPDRRRPVFEVPERVTPPGFVTEAMAARDDGGSFPYRVERALHFSSAAAVYLAKDRAGRQVVLKEARPNAGYGQPDAVHVVDRFPLTANGKVDPRALRALIGAPPAPPAPAP
ncbi:class III lanthionine synthetase LanKC N-terminal domain-containing protein [Kitasatospora cathayae]|uniref:class III lanthionine synthetase LanKC N-terminal domain-containing protein n=1 Tax=Kitasatospora cathayae TaxID=3004092 RepID=UPI0038600EF6